jgi:ubiquitin carboxyl-terminal hydrolase L5
MSAHIGSLRLVADRYRIGEIVSRNPRFIQIHNSFTKSSPFPLYPRNHQNDPQRTEGYHFLTFAPIDGAIYELDGHNKRALNLGYYVRNWVEHMPRVIKNRSRPFPDGTVSSGKDLMSDDKDFRYFCIRTDHISKLENVLSLPILPGWTPELNARREGELERRRQQRAEYNRDNQLRRQNLMPAVLQLFVALAKSGLLGMLIRRAILR